MMYYQITSRNTDIPPFRVRAATYQHAAQSAARRLVGRKQGVSVERVTGDSGKSGYFQAYVPVRIGNGLTSIGRNFHVMER